MPTRRFIGLFLSVIAFLCSLNACGPAQKKTATPTQPEQASSGDIQSKTEYLMGQGSLALAEGDNQTAFDYFLEAARLWDATGQVTVERADAHYEAAGAAYQRLDREVAIEHYEQAVKIYLRFTGNAKAKAAVALTNMGVIYKETSDKAKARTCWQKALDIYNSLPPELQSNANMARIQQNISDMDQGLY